MKSKMKLIALCTAIVAVLALVTAFAIVGSASEATPTLKVGAASLSYKASIAQVFHVAVTNADDVDLLVWTAPQSEYKIGTENYKVTEYNGTDAQGRQQFYFDEFSARQMPEWVYVCAYTNVDDTDYYSPVVKYSILQYAYTKKNSTDPKTRTLAKELLDYGAAAQAALTHNTTHLANDNWLQIKVVGGTLDDGFAKGLYLEGDTPTITAPEADGEGNVFTHWTNSAGNSVSTDRTYQITVGDAEEIYTAVYTTPITEPSFIVSNTTASAGDTNVTVTMSIKNNPGILGILMSIEYDDSVLTLTGATKGGALSTMALTPPRNFASGCNFGWDATDANAEDGDILTLTFSVKDTAAAGAYDVKITNTAGNIIDANWGTPDFDVINGKITIS